MGSKGRGQQTEWGKLLDRLLKQREISLRAFAQRARVAPSLVTYSKRKALAADRIEAWADLLDLSGPARDEFVRLAWIARSPVQVQAMVRQIHGARART